MLLDNGAEFSAISMEFYKEYVAHKGFPKEKGGNTTVANESDLPIAFAVWLLVMIVNYVCETLLRSLTI